MKEDPDDAPRGRTRKPARDDEPDASSAGEDRARPRIEVDAGRGSRRMDVPREPKGKKKKYIWAGVGVLALLLVTFLLSRLEPAAPTVDRDILLFGTVERGSFVREVRGPGTLVPEQIVFVSALTGGRVDRVLVQPGETVTDTTLLLAMSNPDVELEALQAHQQLTAARAGLVDLERSLGTLILQQESQVATTRAEYQDARREAEAFDRLVDSQYVSRNEASTARERAEALRVQLDSEERRLELLRRTMETQLEVQREQVARLQSILAYQERRVASMEVRAGAPGVLQDLSLEVGQWVQPGTTLARVAQPGRLKAELRIPETQARDVQIGQAALIDTRNDSVQGRVRRVDPNVQNASVLVEVRLEGELPPGARPDLSVDGTIEIERLSDVLYVDRPAYGQANSSVSLFKVVEGGDEAARVSVRLGRSSVNQIEIVEGLQEGDRIILTDMSRYDDVDRVRIR